MSARPGVASLDVLRFLAAAFILLFHYGLNAPVKLGELVPVLKQGWLATNFFLLLSGFVLSRAYGDRLVTSRMRRSQFILRRFARLWPSHIVVLMAFGAFVLICEGVGFPPGHMDRYGIPAFIEQAFLVHGWGVTHGPVWNVPTWTLSALLVCYALFSLYVPLIHKRSWPVLAAIGAAVLLAGHFIALTFAHRELADLPFAWGLARAIPLFILGNLLERATKDWRVTPAVFASVVAACLLSLVLLEPLTRSAFVDTVALMALGTILAVSGSVALPENAVTRRMGRASFSLFLTHSLVGAVWFGVSQKLADHFALSLAGQWLLWAMGVALAIATAFAFDALVDKPLSDRVSRLRFLKGEN